MKTFYDKDTDLEWISYSREEAPYFEEFNEYIAEIDSWSNNPKIQKFITTSSNPTVGTMMNGYFNDNKFMDLLFAKRNNEVVAIILLSQNTYLAQKENLKDYLRYQQFNKNPREEVLIQSEQYLGFDDTFQILKQADKSNLYLEYVIINPKYHGKGIGSSVISSISNNIDFFSDGRDVGVIQAAIDNQNIASRKMVIKNNFKKMLPCKTSIPYSVYYCLIKNQDKIEEIQQ